MKPQLLCFIILSTLAIVIAISFAGEGPEGTPDEEAKKLAGGGSFGSITFEVPSVGNVNVYEGEVYAQVKVVGAVDGDGAVVGKVIRNDGEEYEQRIMYPTGMGNEYDAQLPAPAEDEPGPYPGFRIEVSVDFISDPDSTKAQTGLFGVDKSQVVEEAAPVAAAKSVAAQATAYKPEILDPISGESVTPQPLGEDKRLHYGEGGHARPGRG